MIKFIEVLEHKHNALIQSKNKTEALKRIEINKQL